MAAPARSPERKGAASRRSVSRSTHPLGDLASLRTWIRASRRRDPHDGWSVDRAVTRSATDHRCLRFPVTSKPSI